MPQGLLHIGPVPGAGSLAAVYGGPVPRGSHTAVPPSCSQEAPRQSGGRRAAEGLGETSMQLRAPKGGSAGTAAPVMCQQQLVRDRTGGKTSFHSSSKKMKTAEG